jgi:hypothetical protein
MEDSFVHADFHSCLDWKTAQMTVWQCGWDFGFHRFSPLSPYEMDVTCKVFKCCLSLFGKRPLGLDNLNGFIGRERAK